MKLKKERIKRKQRITSDNYSDKTLKERKIKIITKSELPLFEYSKSVPKYSWKKRKKKLTSMIMEVLKFLSTVQEPHRYKNKTKDILLWVRILFANRNSNKNNDHIFESKLRGCFRQAARQTAADRLFICRQIEKRRQAN